MSTEEKNEEILRKSFLPFYLNPTVQVQILTWVCFRFDFTDLGGLYLDLEFELRPVNILWLKFYLDVFLQFSVSMMNSMSLRKH